MTTQQQLIQQIEATIAAYALKVEATTDGLKITGPNGTYVIPQAPSGASRTQVTRRV